MQVSLSVSIYNRKAYISKLKMQYFPHMFEFHMIFNYLHSHFIFGKIDYLALDLPLKHSFGSFKIKYHVSL